ncbi:MAG: glycosyltransferase [Hyphomicrobiales bacterium]|nr:glycosyltransferase [Hyphomicrobiales bacterium]
MSNGFSSKRASDPTVRPARHRVSVVITFFNSERFLAEAIDSVLAQDFRDFELILVDDGSTDRSSEIACGCVRRGGGKVLYLEHDGHTNRGISASRNLGVGAASGEYIAFIDADDVWLPRKLSEQVVLMDEHPELGIVAGTARYWYSWANGEDVLIPTGHVQDRTIFPPEALLLVYPLGNAAAPCNDFLIRSELLHRLGGFEEQFTGMYEDQALLVKLYLSAPVYFSTRVWLNYRQHPDSCVTSATREGIYHDVRLYFLTWFEQYLAASKEASDPRIVAALNRALRPYRHPRLHTLLSIPRRMRGALGKLKRRVRCWARSKSRAGDLEEIS